jgi:hypothetical protein
LAANEVAEEEEQAAAVTADIPRGRQAIMVSGAE